ncbi:DNA gyrase inhibitor YacG [Oceanibacterium hippocampi]
MPEGGGPRKPARCPICGKPAEAGNRPFCSPRCKDLDLGRWLDGRYAIPTEEAPGEPPPVTDRDEQE